MTTTSNRHAAPWTARRILAMLTGRATPNLLQARAGTWSNPAVLTGREAVARHLFGETVQWSALDMLDYDNTPLLRVGWLAEADRRINTPDTVLTFEDLRIARWHGYTPEQWKTLPALVKVDKRESYFQVQGMAS